MDSAPDSLHGGELVRAVADAVAARDEDHTDRAHARHEERVVVRARNHAHAVQPQRVCGALDGVDDGVAARCGGVLIDEVDGDLDTSACSNLVRASEDLRHNAVPSRPVDVADVNLEHCFARDAIYRPWRDLEESGCADGVVGTRSENGSLNCERKLSPRQTRVVSVRHQQRAGVSATAAKLDAQRCGRSDRSDDSDIEALLLEERPLLNVELDKSIVEARPEVDALEHVRMALAPAVACAARRLTKAPLLCVQNVHSPVQPLHRKRPCHCATADAPESEARGLLRGEHDHVDGAPWDKPRLLERTDSLNGAENPQHTVVHTSARNGVRV
mmetsp:Transcript_12307/g.40406  ORF Transcript_12307/g.40406 Transcript_12307/m.40406 type:complete len:330 (-) Transcript_12307:383-1372(-)